ncbi:hypothetical protein CE91St19_32530 [Odoribacter laneus]|jgi:hypothetical protein|nr:hypothetical protein CE91St19_32530 [Odoribacter laneus]GKI27046.1 hypothetical protein CE91St20_31830 [Odoribacter laneus]
MYRIPKNSNKVVVPFGILPVSNPKTSDPREMIYEIVKTISKKENK